MTLSANTPATDWAATFSAILGTAVDTGAAYALQSVENKQAKTLAEQKTVQTTAAAAATVAQAQSTDWQKIALIGGAAVLGLGVLALVLRRS